MAGLNDTLTLGLILVLLFGAVSLYLYTRIQQCEQKLNLVESILLDIKMSAELQGYPEPPPAPQQSQIAASNSSSSYSDDKSNTSSTISPFVSMDEQDLYQGALAEALEESAEPIEAEEILPSPSTAETLPKVTTNYESMTLAELKALAKQRGITGSSSMKRSQILEALKPKTEKVPSDGGILSALAEQGSPVDA
jgi:Rho termination factor, N-terminal domain